MFKKIFIALLAIFIFLGVSVYMFRANIKQYAITTILKSFPLPNVALANVNFDETSGKLQLEEIKVKNPRGFKSKHIMKADSVNMDISFTTKPKLRLNISEIDIVKPVLYIERSPGDKWNILEYPKQSLRASNDRPSPFNFMREAFADETEKKSEIILPRKIRIDKGAVRLMDNFVSPGKTHVVDFLPVTGVVSLDYLPKKNIYEKIQFRGSCSIDGDTTRIIKAEVEARSMPNNPSYAAKLNASNIPVSTLKPYLDRYTPFIVTQGTFNMASNVKAVGGLVEGDHTMELMNLQFAINPKKSNTPFLETSVQKLTLYLTNQKGNVVIDFKQRGRLGGKMNWSLGPIAKRAVGMMAIDTVIDLIKKGQGGEGGLKDVLPGDVPPEVIDIFKGILR